MTLDWLAWVVAPVFALLGLVCLALTIVSLPGGWIMLALAVIVELTDGLYMSVESPQTFGVAGYSGWLLLVVCALMLGVGEIVELAAGAAGAKGGGATKRGMWGALIGGMLGALVLTPFIPVPIVGTLIGAVVGTFAGAVLGEITHPHKPMTVTGSIMPATGATIGRILGTVAKLAMGIVVWIVLTVAVFWP